jgi:hypothetical protein
MKIIRLGFTESGLLLLNYTHRYVELSPDSKIQLLHNMKWLINWLYTTSGYYDKEVEGSNKNFTDSAYTANLDKLIEHWEIAVNGCEETQLMFHNGFISEMYNCIKEPFLHHYQIKNIQLFYETNQIIDRMPEYYEKIPHYYEKMRGKKILVVSSFAELCVQQYITGNVDKLGLGFPHVERVVGVTTPYCFLNKGPHNSYFETLTYIFEEIKKADFDVAVLGCGVYGHMLTHLIHSELEKDSIYLGGCVTNLFGILSTREKNGGMGKYIKTNEFWILNIPDEYKPLDYKEIEDGCYW